jgi:hypothetical protein
MVSCRLVTGSVVKEMFVNLIKKWVNLREELRECNDNRELDFLL